MYSTVSRRALAALLAVVMVLALVPAAGAKAEVITTWTKVQLSEIKPTDVIAVTMTKTGGNTYALFNGNGTSAAPTAVLCTVAEDGLSMTTDGDGSTLKWNISASTVTVGEASVTGYTFFVNGSTEKWLYSTNTNNGVRVGTNANANTNKVWVLDDSGYLKNTGTPVARYLGVYLTNPDWRTYTNTIGNTANQTLAFWKFSKTEDNAPVTPPEEPEEPGDTKVKYAKLAASIAAGDAFYIYNADSKVALTATVSGTKLAGATSEPDVDLIPITEGMTLVTAEAAATEGQFYLRTGAEGSYLYLTSKPTGSGVSFEAKVTEGTDYALWTLETQTDGYYIKNVNAAYTKNEVSTPQYLEYYNGFTTYSLGSGGAAYLTSFYKPTDEKPAEEPVVTTVDINKATVAGTEYTVKGVVTMIDKKNVYIQDATGGICAYMAAAPDGIALGDTLIVTGKYKVYNGLPELDGATFEKDSGLSLKAAPKTISTLTNADVCTYVSLTGLTVTEVYDKNGEYTTPNITVKDADGKTIQIYKAIVGMTDSKWDIAVGDVLSFKGAVGIYNTTLQLRNTLISEITKPVLLPGDKVVIYNPASKMALSANAVATYYRAGVEMTPNSENGFDSAAASEVWDVSIGADGNYVFSNGGKKLSMNADRNSLPLDEANSTWKVEPATTAGCYYLINAGRTDKTYYVEWYASFTEFSTYTYKESSEGIYAMQLVKVAGASAGPELPKDGKEYVIYSEAGAGVFGKTGSGSVSIPSIAAELDKANGVVMTDAATALVFKVSVADGKYTFENGGKYLATNDKEELFLADEESEYTKWTLTANSNGYIIYSAAAKYNGSPVCIEFYNNSYSGWTYKSSTADIFTFLFYPIGTDAAAPKITLPDPIPDADMGADYTLTFAVADVGGIKSVTASIKEGAALTVAKNEDGTYSVVIPAATVIGSEIELAVIAEDNSGNKGTAEAKVKVVDRPSILSVTPAANSATGDEKKPVIGVEFANGGDAPTVELVLNGGEPIALSPATEGTAAYTPAEAMKDGRYDAKVTVTKQNGEKAELEWSFVVGTPQYQLYFGQIHSHTNYSDGSGTLGTALEYINNIPESDSVDFVAITDHSNYFDSSAAANPAEALYDTSKMTSDSLAKWTSYKEAIAAFNKSNTSGRLVLGGFEMTWSGGPGHMNTYNSAGIVSRNNSTLNSKTDYAGMKAYYALLGESGNANTISQFNHPGSTFGTFGDFDFWDALTDSRITLIEVGNGEGDIGSGGYFSSYEYYTMALDKGWHVAPTNNQDNHKGEWGNGNTARTVILTDDFTEDGIYDALRDMHVYSTEDKNLEIIYTLNDYELGSIIEDVPASLDVDVYVYDPDNSDSIRSVELVANSGKVVYKWSAADIGSGNISCTLAPDYTYYYVRVVQGDGDIAVTAPVWVGDALNLGISAVACSADIPVTDEELTLSVDLFNSEASNALIKSLEWDLGGEKITVENPGTVEKSGKLTVELKHTFTNAKVLTATVTAVMELEGLEYSFSKSLELDVLKADDLLYVGIDASHANEYVNGNYKDSVGNFAKLASGYSVRNVILSTSEELIAACSNQKYKMIVLSVPSRRDGTKLRYPYFCYSDDEIAAITDFNKAGGVVVVTGWSDYYESYGKFTAADHMAAQQNKLLAALGSSLRISDDATNDSVLNGGQSQRLYLNSFNFNNALASGIVFDEAHPNDRAYTEVFSQYGGASIYASDASGAPVSALPSTVSPLVFAHSSTVSTDSDSDGIGGNAVPKYEFAADDKRLLVMATEQLGSQGLIVVSGAAFFSDFEIQATLDNASEKNYSNYRILENLIGLINPVKVSTIAEVWDSINSEGEGKKFTIEGVVTSNASGYDKPTAFFDCIYVQDGTRGINVFPVAGNFKIGDVVRVTGVTASYGGEAELTVLGEVKKIGEAAPAQPEVLSAAGAMSPDKTGSLVRVQGQVTAITLKNGIIEGITLRDANGGTAYVFMDGYIMPDYDGHRTLSVGDTVSAIGLASVTVDDAGGSFIARLRVRNRAEVVIMVEGVPPESGNNNNSRPSTPGSATGIFGNSELIPLSPQTGETGTLAGFVMLALLVLAIPAYILGRKRARTK